jgi:hypothetical protein
MTVIRGLSTICCAISLPNETVAIGCRLGRSSVTCTESFSSTDLQVVASTTRAKSEIFYYYLTTVFITAGAIASAKPKPSPTRTAITSSGAFATKGAGTSLASRMGGIMAGMLATLDVKDENVKDDHFSKMEKLKAKDGISPTYKLISFYSVNGANQLSLMHAQVWTGCCDVAGYRAPVHGFLIK